MEVARQRALVLAVAANKKKEKERASSLTPKDVTKVSSKRKSEGKDDHPLKKDRSSRKAISRRSHLLLSPNMEWEKG